MQLMHLQGRYLEAACTHIEPDKRTLNACFPRHAGLASHCFSLSYDILILATGSVNNTFGIQVCARCCACPSGLQPACLPR